MSEDAGPFDRQHEPCSEFPAICDGSPHRTFEGIQAMTYEPPIIIDDLYSEIPIDAAIEAKRTLSFIIDYLIAYSLSEQNTIGELMYRLRKDAE